MKYAMLIYTAPGTYEELSEAERRSVSAEYYAIRDEPECVAGAHLGPIDSATTVRVRDGQALTTDGPFADTKEVFGGYYVFELDDLDRALEIAARIPSARLGGAIEVRPVVETRA